MEKLKTNKTLWIFLGLTAAGLILRVISCFWGYPYPLHGDEPTTVMGTIHMLEQHSYLAQMFYHPDHFQIKCLALLFQIVSYVCFGLPAHKAFYAHMGGFYVIGRLYTAFWGTLMIPLAYMILEKCRKGSGLLGAALVAFYPIFVTHSAYATPDIVLTFFIMLIAYISMMYLEKPSVWKLVGISACIGISVTIKYTGAVACLWLAAIVIYQRIKEKKYWHIISDGALCMAVAVLVSFAIGPNLYTDYKTTIDAIFVEATFEHLGADGLSAWEHFIYYLEVVFNAMGIEAFVFMILGIVYMFRKHTIALVNLSLGLIFWVFTSCLALHWERWGIPFYVFMMMFVVLGFFWVIDMVSKIGNVKVRKISKLAVNVVMLLILGNAVFSGLWVARFSSLEDSRVQGKEFCMENGINEENTVFEGYSPLEMNGSTIIPIGIDKSGNIMMPNDKRDAKFFMVSSGMYGRFYAEPERYAGAIAMYEAIEDTCDLIYESEIFAFHSSKWSAVNIVYKIMDIINCQGKCTGPIVKIYRIPWNS